MATVHKNVSKKTGEVLNWKWTALLERDAFGKQIKITKRVPPLDEDLTPKQEQKKMKRLADEWEEKERAEYLKNKERDGEGKAQVRKERDKITLADFIDKHWMVKHVKKGVKPHTPDTIAFYTHMSDDIKSYFETEVSPNFKLSQIEKEDVLDYLAYMRNDAKTKRGTPYGATTIQHHYSTLRNILNYAVYLEYLKENPCEKVRPDDRPKRERKEIDFLDVDESIKFLKCLDDESEKQYWKKNNRDPLFWKCLVNLLITTGLRRGELVGLQWGDIDRKNMLLNVQRNVTIDTSNKTEKDPEKKIHIGQLKGRGKEEARKVPISKYVLELLDSYKTSQEETTGTKFLPNAFIFCKDGNHYLPLYPTEPTRMMKKYIERHNLPDMSPHDLRHTAGYLAIESGANVKQIQALLGHKDPAVSLKFYVGITEKAEQETVNGIENLIRPKAEEKQA